MADLQTALKRIFLVDPLIYRMCCQYRLVVNNNMHCIIRYWLGYLEINQEAVAKISEDLLYDEIVALMIRLLLHHPTSRRPVGVDNINLSMASDMVLHGQYPFLQKKLSDMHHFPEGQDLAFYAIRLQFEYNQLKIKMLDSNDENQIGQMSVKPVADGKIEAGCSENILTGGLDYRALDDYSAGWQENAFEREKTNRIIQQAALSGSWGRIFGKLREVVMASMSPEIDYRDILRGFQTSIISSNRELTRMRPNRRSGFLQMGSKRKLQAKLLLAIDVSGSVSSQSLSLFYGVINNLFKFGLESVDVVQFDAEISTRVVSLRKAQPTIEICGRGGTNFQSVIDFVAKDKTYNGVIYFTDGFAPVPDIPKGFNAKILWLLDSKGHYLETKDSLSTVGRVTWIDVQNEAMKMKL